MSLFRRCGLVLLAAAVTVGYWHDADAPCFADEPSTVEAAVPLAQPNVFLSQWKLLGPIIDSPDASPSVKELVPDPSSLRGDETIKVGEKTIPWIDWSYGSVDFSRAMKDSIETDPRKRKRMVGFAVAQFRVAQPGPAFLGVGYDDTATVWLNGEKVFEDRKSVSSCFLDESVTPVTLREGINRIVLRVGDRGGEWEAVARVLTTKPDKPLVEFTVNHGTQGDLRRLPRLHVMFVDGDGQPIREIETSGYRRGSRVAYVAYGEPLDRQPESVHVVWSGDGVKTKIETHPWSKVRDGKFNLRISPDQPIRFMVVDDAGGKPIANAQIWKGRALARNRSAPDGSVRLYGFAPLADHVYVVAEGYQAEKVELSWPFRGTQTIRLQRGGRVVKGKVLATDGTPIEGAKIRPGLYRGYIPTPKTAADGSFAIFGVPESKTSLYPVIEADGYVTKDTFGEKLSGELTEVIWQLAPETIVTGRVVDKQTGEGIGGVTITAGHSRFASNRKNPSVQSAADGSFRLRGVPEGQVLVHALSKKHAPVMETLTTKLGETNQVSFQLQAGKPVTGIVRDPSGKPLRGVWLVADTWNGVRMFQRETRTGPDGTFTLAHMPDSPAEVHVLLRDYVSNRDLNVTGGDEVELTLAPVVQHVVTVRAADSGELVPNLKPQIGYKWTGRSEFNWDSRSSRLDRNFDAAKGQLIIRDSEPIQGEVAFRFRAPGYRDLIVPQPAAGSPSQKIDLEMEPVETIGGRLVHCETGAGVSGATVAVVSEQDRLRSFYVKYRAIAEMLEDFTGIHVKSDADGYFDFPKLDDPHGKSLVVIGPDGGFHKIDKLASVLGDDELTLPVVPAGRIEGRLIVAGKPVANQSVYLSFNGMDRQPRYDSAFGVSGSVTTDADGRFEIGSLGPGRYQLMRVREFDSPAAGGMSMYLSGQTVPVLPGETTKVNLETPSGHSVTGVTVNEEGQPLGNCVVEVTKSGDRVTRVEAVRSDSSGRFQIDHLPSGDYDLSATEYVVAKVNTCGLGNAASRGMMSVAVRGDTKAEIELAPLAPASAESIAGTVAPDFSATPLDADPVTLSDHWGKVVVLDFWATWCGPCIAAMPEFQSLVKKYEDNADVVFLTVSLDQDEKPLREMIEEREFQFPVIYSGDAWQSEIARQFGVNAIPASFVIGRDGTFAADRLSASQWAGAIESALANEVDPIWDHKRPLSIRVATTMNGEPGAPDVRISLEAIAKDGKVIRESDLRPSGLHRQSTWRYPAIEGAKIVVTATAAGQDEQVKELIEPDDGESISFDFTTSQAVVGRLVDADDQAVEQSGVKVSMVHSDGWTSQAVTDDAGEFELPALPGRFTLMVQEQGDWVGVLGRNDSVTVRADRQPRQVSLAVCQPTTLRGRLLGANGKPVSSGSVSFGRDQKTEANEDGEFELAGIPSRGTVTIVGRTDDGFGQIKLTDADSEEPIVIAISTGSAVAAIPIGTKLPEMSLTSLAGDSSSLSDKSQSRLVLIAPSWHPGGRDLIDRATRYSSQNDVPLDWIATDWSRSQARRFVESSGFRGNVHWAGPAGLELPVELKYPRPSASFLLSSEGRIELSPIQSVEEAEQTP